MKKINYWLFTTQAVFALILLSGCATILSNNNNSANGVYINSNVADAKVFNEKNQLIGTTPLFYKLSKDQSIVKLSIEKENYETQKIQVIKSEKNIFVFLDAMLLCIPCLVDYPTGNIYKLNQDTFSLSLRRIYDEKVERVDFLFEETKFKIEDGQRVGININEPLHFKKSSFNTYFFKSNLCENQKYSRYQILNCNSTSEEQNNLMLNGNTIQINPTINTLKANYLKLKGKYVSKVEANITWKFYKRSGKVIKEVTTSHSVSSDILDVKKLLAQVVNEAFLNIMNDDENYDLFIKESKSEDGEISLFNELVLKKQPTPSFSKNKDLVAYLMKGVVTVKQNDGHGSGFFISNDGYLITNYHVVEKNKKVSVQLNESITLNADVIRTDERYDLALLKVDGSNFRGLEFINSDSAQTGEDVFAIGTPGDVSLGQSVTKGIISGKRKIANKIFLQTDVSINGGNSGGPLLNEDGKIIGMVTMKLVGQGIEGLGFCVPSNVILEMLNIKIK